MSIPPDIEFDDLKDALHVALRTWHKQVSLPNSFLSSLILIQEKQIDSQNDTPEALHLAINKVLLELVEELQKHSEQYARLLKYRFFDRDTILMTANKLGLSVDQVKKNQQKAIKILTEMLLVKERAAREIRIQASESKLVDCTYSELFGVEQTKNNFIEKLLSPSSPWVLSIVGIGGIGKTSLADAIARQILQHLYFVDIIWLHFIPGTPTHNIRMHNLGIDTLMAQLAAELNVQMVPGASLSQRDILVRQILKSLPHLVVIDNLESETDTAALLQHLNNLANPSKFLLTARSHPPNQIGVYSFALPELSLEDASALIHHHAQEIGLNDLAQAEVTQVQPIYEVVGGNPLALKLVVGLTSVYPLPQILSDLVKVQFEKIEEMYLHIYWQAWHSLNEYSRQLLEIMPLATGVGLSPEEMLAASRLEQQQLWIAVNELVNRSLLEVKGTAWERFYSIHRLTETFLRTEIIHWPEDML